MSNLIPRLERATGPDRELDGDIALANGWRHEEAEYGKGISGQPLIKHTWTSPSGEEFWEKTTIFDRANKYPEELPHYTASLDAALTLVPEGCQWTIEADTAWLRWPEGDKIREAQGAFNRSGGKKTALALCIAALKAREENA